MAGFNSRLSGWPFVRNTERFPYWCWLNQPFKRRFWIFSKKPHKTPTKCAATNAKNHAEEWWVPYPLQRTCTVCLELYSLLLKYKSNNNVTIMHTRTHTHTLIMIRCLIYFNQKIYKYIKQRNAKPSLSERKNKK